MPGARNRPRRVFMSQIEVQPALLIDARNAIYRAIYAVRADHRPGIKYHYFIALLRQITNWINVHRPSSIHIFWDAPRSTVWRKEVLSTYKDRSDSEYVENISEDLILTTNVAKEFFAYMNVRQYERKQMEADDLIYAAVSVLHPRPTIIVSTDSDMTQIPFRFSSSSVFDPKEMAAVPIPECHPAYLKALVGDKSDSISGYYGIGPKKGHDLLANPQNLQEYLTLKGAKMFHLNLLLIDLSFCPRLLANTIYFQKKMVEEIKFSKEEILKLTMKHKVNGMQAEFANLIPPFKNLV